MEIEQKCSSKKHSNMNAILYCQECKLYMCNKCSNFHSELFENHNYYNLDKEIKEIFTGICKEEKHNIELEYYCKTHNQLCCAACISKIKGYGNGQHTDCNVYHINDIQKEKKKSLINNITILKNLSKDIEKIIDELKKLYEKMNEDKEDLKLKISTIFTKFRNMINDTEDKLLIRVDNIFENLFFKEELIKKTEKMPITIKDQIEKGNIMKKEWENSKLNSLINDCINIDNSIKNIQIINENIEKYKNSEIKIYCITDEEIWIILKK